MKEQFLSKIVIDWQEAKNQIQSFKNNGQSIVFTNGCFDLIHTGHIHFLKEASDLGDRLIIGVNSDASVKKLKGEKRPILSLQDRMEMLSALEMTDLIIPFEEETPLELIKAVEPDILVKGGDYGIDEIVGSEFVLSNGGSVKTLGFLKGKSTTAIIQKIKTMVKDD